MRTRPIGTGPFKFVEFKPNEVIRVTRNPDYWKQGRPYLDGIEYRIIPNLATRILGFVSDKFDTVTGVTVPLKTAAVAREPCRSANTGPVPPGQAGPFVVTIAELAPGAPTKDFL